MKKIWVLLFFITAVLLPACAPNTVYEPINGCEIRPRTQCSELDLSFSNLSGANLSGADLSGADLRMTNLFKANLSKADLRGARYNKDTKFPEGFDPEAAGMMLYEL